MKSQVKKYNNCVIVKKKAQQLEITSTTLEQGMTESGHFLCISSL